MSDDDEAGRPKNMSGMTKISDVLFSLAGLALSSSTANQWMTIGELAARQAEDSPYRSPYSMAWTTGELPTYARTDTLVRPQRTLAEPIRPAQLQFTRKIHLDEEE